MPQRGDERVGGFGLAMARAGGGGGGYGELLIASRSNGTLACTAAALYLGNVDLDAAALGTNASVAPCVVRRSLHGRAVHGLLVPPGERGLEGRRTGIENPEAGGKAT